MQPAADAFEESEEQANARAVLAVAQLYCTRAKFEGVGAGLANEKSW